MAYTKTTWVEGVTPLGPVNMNKIEEGIETVHEKVDGLVGDSNDDLASVLSMFVPVDTRTIEATAWHTSGKPSTLLVKNGATTIATMTLTYNANNKLDVVTVVVGGRTITYTYTWSGSQFVSRSKAVV